MDPTANPLAAFTAPASWQAIDFISDLHLQASEPETISVWADYMANGQADAVFILGDLFEVWVGDDSLSVPDSTEALCTQVLQQASSMRALFFMHGNRDFLLGPTAALACGMTLLDDPCRLEFGDFNCLLSHGDALCIDDTDYIQFRQLVRTTAWQKSFLAEPLAQRVQQAQGLRRQSEARKKSAAVYADVDTRSAVSLLEQHACTVLIHGHTHRPADHILATATNNSPRLTRNVLSDWDANAKPARAEVLRLSRNMKTQRVSIERMSPQDACQHIA